MALSSAASESTLGRAVSTTPLLSAGSGMDDSARAIARKGAKEAARFNKMLPAGLIKVCILGDTDFKSPETKELAKAVGLSFSRKLQNKAIVLTLGRQGVQAAFCDGLKEGGFPNLFHLMPTGGASALKHGKDLNSTSISEAELREAFVRLGQVHLTFEGGPDVATMANEAFVRGSVVVPCMCTGGASAGGNGLMPEALERPTNISSDKEWAMLKEVPYRKEIVAFAVTAMVEKAANRASGSSPGESNPETRNRAPSETPSGGGTDRVSGSGRVMINSDSVSSLKSGSGGSDADDDELMRKRKQAQAKQKEGASAKAKPKAKKQMSAIEKATAAAAEGKQSKAKPRTSTKSPSTRTSR